MYMYYWQFIERDRLQVAFIHEHFSGSEVKFSLALMVRGQDKLTLVFEDVYPGYDVLKKVYKACLFDTT